MEYVYLLTNLHVPNLVKFGFSRRDPRTRAAELSAPTGVPGRWEVYHFWEVEDGKGVEQEVFFRLNSKRLSRQEFFKMQPAEAVAAISDVIDLVGTNPTQRIIEEMEAEKKAAVRRAAEREALRLRLQAIDREVAAAIRPIEEQDSYKRASIAISFSAATYMVGASFNSDKPLLGALWSAAGWVVVGWLLALISPYRSFLFPRSSGAIDEMRRGVLAKHGITSEEAYRVLQETAYPDLHAEFFRDPDSELPSIEQERG